MIQRWIASGPTAGFNALVLLAVIGIVAELYGDDFPGWLKPVVVVVVLALSSLVFYVQFLRPTMDAEQEHREQLMAILFKATIDRYLQVNPGTYHLRANVMTMRRNKIGFPTVLKIDYYTTDYLPAELALEFPVGAECSG